MVENQTTQVFTAAQVAAALRIKPQSVRQMQAGIEATASRIVNGQITATWSYGAFSPRLRERLNAEAKRRGLESAEALLNQPAVKGWAPALPISEIAQECIDKATKLQRALAGTLARLANDSLSAGEQEALGVRDYAAVFGYQISERRLRDLVTRTIERDGGAENWARLEIYFDERLSRKEEQETKDFRTLQPVCNAIAELSLGACDDLSRRASLWDKVFYFYQESVDAGNCGRKTKRRLLKLLRQHASFLAPTENALRVNFERKFARWSAGRGFAAIDDRRLSPAPRPDPYIFPDDEYKYLLMLCTKLDNIDLGWREFLASNHASAETKLFFAHDPSRSRRRTPGWIRRKLENDVRNQQNYVRGPRTVASKGSYVSRDPNANHAGDSDQADDKTLDLYWWEETPEGLWLGQGQLIVWIDERSWFIYGFNLRTDPAYTGFTLRNSWSEKAQNWGLPRKRIYVEKGTWKDAKVFAGRRRELDPEESELAIKRLGIRFCHAQNPQGKVIERVFGSLTDRLALLPGYAGRNQMLDKFEAVQKCKRLVQSGRQDPREKFLHKSQLVEHLNDLVVTLNKEPKYGKYHAKEMNGTKVYLSPEQAYQEFFGSEPLVKIPDSVRHLLRCNKIEETVTRNGVAFQFGKTWFEYKNHVNFGKLEGQRVSVWFDPSDPSTASVTDKTGKNPFVVRRESQSDGTPEGFARAAESNKALNSYNKEVNRMLKPVFQKDFQERMFRYPVVDKTALAFGVETGRQKEQLQSDRKEGNEVLRIAARHMRSQGLPESYIQNLTPERAAEIAQSIEEEESK